MSGIPSSLRINVATRINQSYLSPSASMRPSSCAAGTGRKAGHRCWFRCNEASWTQSNLDAHFPPLEIPILVPMVLMSKTLRQGDNDGGIVGLKHCAASSWYRVTELFKCPTLRLRSYPSLKGGNADSSLLLCACGFSAKDTTKPVGNAVSCLCSARSRMAVSESL
jgi:hypothetical protein